MLVFIMREDILGHFFCSCKHLKLGEEHSCLQKFPLHKTLGSEKPSFGMKIIYKLFMVWILNSELKIKAEW